MAEIKPEERLRREIVSIQHQIDRLKPKTEKEIFRVVFHCDLPDPCNCGYTMEFCSSANSDLLKPIAFFIQSLIKDKIFTLEMEIAQLKKEILKITNEAEYQEFKKEVEG